MPEYVTAQRKITFKTGLPLGRHATFTHERELWIAVPMAKYGSMRAVTDQLIHALHRLRREATRWLSVQPGDAERVAMLLGIIANADHVASTATVDKAKAVTA